MAARVAAAGRAVRLRAGRGGGRGSPPRRRRGRGRGLGRRRQHATGARVLGAAGGEAGGGGAAVRRRRRRRLARCSLSLRLAMAMRSAAFNRALFVSAAAFPLRTHARTHSLAPSSCLFGCAHTHTTRLRTTTTTDDDCRAPRCRECVALCLGNWVRLPPTPGSAGHAAHLATFSRLVEAQESAAMLQVRVVVVVVGAGGMMTDMTDD